MRGFAVRFVADRRASASPEYAFLAIAAAAAIIAFIQIASDRRLCADSHESRFTRRIDALLPRCVLPIAVRENGRQ